ncbi:fungal specific transcription factor [Purpureocillium lavendulum]|uniref:Fungal specific transcription factor n=1 Tax=Purpureocillium lavendulum TaxID=1247861 RepID=A0AB34FVX6_9HYPO|nr:fungal specific transcription factor [Purpureocillium lavendulum]
MANIGHIFCAGVISALAACSLIAMLVATLGGIAHSNLCLFRINATDLSISPSIFSGWTGVCRPGRSDPRKIFATADDAFLGAKPANVTGADLGVHELYDVSLWGYCHTARDGTRACSWPALDWARPALERAQTHLRDRLDAAGGGRKVSLPTYITGKAEDFGDLARRTGMVSGIAVVALAVELYLGVAAVRGGRRLPRGGFHVSWIAALALWGAAVSVAILVWIVEPLTSWGGAEARDRGSDHAYAHDDDPAPGADQPRYIRSRIANACDGCKARKVKCDGKLPCGYCAGRQRPHTCHYSPQRKRRPRASASAAASRTNGVGATSSPLRRRASRSPEAESRGRNGAVASETAAGARLSTDPSSSSRMEPRSSRTGDRDATAENNKATPGSRRRTPSRVPAGSHRRSTETSPAAEDDTEVPREARLLCDSRGKLIFIGDCAPLSFFQSVRQLVTSRVGQNAFAPESSRYSVLENNAPTGLYGSGRERSAMMGGGRRDGPPEVRARDVPRAVANYRAMTTGLVDLFDDAQLLDDLLLWVDLETRNHQQGHHHQRTDDDLGSVVNYLVLAIGLLPDDEPLSRAYFEHARDCAYGTLSANLSVGTVQAFALVTVYMLCSCQINGAFLFFAVSARAAYSIGLHRTEVNARFGPAAHRQRDQLWRSLRVVDLFLSTSMGRPPATSDVDCTVPYRRLAGEDDTAEEETLLDASVQILLITECIVLEVYSRKKISLQLTEGISRQLRDWSTRWLQRLKDVVAAGRPAAHGDNSSTEASGTSETVTEAQAIGACQVLASYYYSVMLVSRPFLMYELFRRLSDSPAKGAGQMASGKGKLADACIDAASLMVEPILDLVDRGMLNVRVPLIVSWLFASSLVLGVGLLGGFGRILEKHGRAAIAALDHLAKADGHAVQYSLVAQSLLETAREYLERREAQERLRRTENSSQLFGLMPSSSGAAPSPGARSSPGALAGRSPSAVASPGLGLSGGAIRGVREAHDPRLAGASFLHHQGGLSAGVGGVGTPRMATALGGEGVAHGNGHEDTAGSSFFGLTAESLMQTPDGNYWNEATFGPGGEAEGASALNLFPLMEAGGGIDLAHYLERDKIFAAHKILAAEEGKSGACDDISHGEVDVYMHVILDSETDMNLTSDYISAAVGALNANFRPANFHFNLRGVDWNMDGIWAKPLNHTLMKEVFHQGGRNALNQFMSYGSGSVQEFTAGQIRRMHSFWARYRSQGANATADAEPTLAPIQPIHKDTRLALYPDPNSQRAVYRDCRPDDTGASRETRESYCGTAAYCRWGLWKHTARDRYTTDRYSSASQSCMTQRRASFKRIPWREATDDEEEFQHLCTAGALFFAEDICGTKAYCDIFDQDVITFKHFWDSREDRYRYKSKEDCLNAHESAPVEKGKEV